MGIKLFTKLQASDLLSKEDWGSEKLKLLAEQLLSYRAPINFLGTDDDDDGEEGDDDDDTCVGGVSSTVAIPEKIAEHLHKLPPNLGKKKAAVLVCLFHDEHGDLRVLLTKRSTRLSSHPGEVALPGGKRDEEDASNAETALREAREEIGLDSSLVRVVTYLEPFLSKYLLRVTPVVALLLDRSKVSLTPNAGEVDAIFDAPLEMFLKEDEKHRIEKREWIGLPYSIHYFDFETNNEKYTIWGMTSAILVCCASVIYQRAPEFEISTDLSPLTNHVPI